MSKQQDGGAEKLFLPSGALEEALAEQKFEYEYRRGQADMAASVERAIDRNGVLLCEAGTGTGKTLAYLVPALKSKKKVVISTATRALQDQILASDAPLAASLLGVPLRVALMKGLSNYVCRRRFEEARKNPSHAGSRKLPLLESWVQATKHGDVSELSSFSENDPLWSEVSSSSDTRIGARCSFHRECFVTQMKERAEQADLIIVNHHLFFADLRLKRTTKKKGYMGASVLPPYDVVIFDEAHQLEDIATAFLGTRLSKRRVERFLRDSERLLSTIPSASFRKTAEMGGERITFVREAEKALECFFSALVQRRSRGDGREVLPKGVWDEGMRPLLVELDESLGVIEDFASKHSVSESVEQLCDRAATLRDDLNTIADPATDHVNWVTVEKGQVSVTASPIDLSQFFRDEVFVQNSASVLTSATLTTGKQRSFSFLRSRLGLAGDIGVPFEAISVDSPFDYESCAALYTPTDLPDPKAPGFVGAAKERVLELINITGGGAFVLSTSVRMMQELSMFLRRRSTGLVLVQGEQPKHLLLEQFRKDGHAVLVATMSFWEGIDVKGDALRLVVMDKIPFLVPTDPVVLAKSASLEARGQNAFAKYFVPQAAITLKQGFGRLIRTQRDRGIVSVLDRRLSTKGYGLELMASLPPALRVSELSQVREFWLRVSQNDQR